jgi:ribosomal protein S13
LISQLNNISKKFTSINQSHLSIEYANMSMSGFKNTLYGFGQTHAWYFSQKFERHLKYTYLNFKKKYKFFNKKIYNIFPTSIALHKKHTLNVYVLDMIQSYKGTRHARGLPCRGQRTWTNAWTAYRANSTLRVFKIKLLNRIYKKTPHSQINTYYLAEQINLLWKVFWKDEWANARKKVIVVTKKKNFNIDVVSMSRGNVVSPTRLKKLSKKQKSSLGKNNLTLGFEVGFTKQVLTDLYKRNKLKMLKTIKSKPRKKKIDIKTKRIKHRIKKKSKKSLWD